MRIKIPSPQYYRVSNPVEQKQRPSQVAMDDDLMVKEADYNLLRDYADLLESKLYSEDSVDIKAEPADSYPSLRKQFLSLRSFANAKAKQASFYRAVSEGLFGSRLAGSESNLSSEREANQRLTNLLEASEQRCEQLLKEIETMKSQQGNAYPEGHILVPEVPSDECLMSMSIRYDHGLAVPGYYDNDMFRKAGAPTHEQKLKSTLETMRQLYQEATGQGFFTLNVDDYKD